MRLVVLTTQTPHHAWFVQELNKQFPVRRVYLETEPLPSPPFETAHPFESERDDYERGLWFGGGEPEISAQAPARVFRRMNEPAAVAALAEEAADAVVVFGTGKLSDEVIAAVPGALVNLHGGDPETHRGLDAHLWAVREGAFDSLVSCLHRVAPALDAGDIVGMRGVPVPKDAPLSSLRRFNTEACLELTLAALGELRSAGRLSARPQTKAGRLYSFMPAEMKTECVRAFAAWTASLAGPVFTP